MKMVVHLRISSCLVNMVQLAPYNDTTVMNGETFQIVSLGFLLIVSVVETADMVEVHTLEEDLVMYCYRSVLVFLKNTYGMISSSWILLDTCSASGVCNNEEIVVNICDCTSDETLTVYTNRGSKNFTQMASFKFLPMEVHFNPYSMSNILGLSILLK